MKHIYSAGVVFKPTSTDPTRLTFEKYTTDYVEADSYCDAELVLALRARADVGEQPGELRISQIRQMEGTFIRGCE